LRGSVITFDPATDTGVISSADGNRYGFVIADWYGLGRAQNEEYFSG
jgi:hypothetical protein